MLHCQALRTPRIGFTASAAIKPLRQQRPCRVVCAAPPDGGLPTSGGAGGVPKPGSSSRRQASSSAGSSGSGLGQSDQELLDASLLRPAFAGGAAVEEVGAGAATTGSGGVHAAAAPSSGAGDSSADDSWTYWQDYFYEMDDVVSELDSIQDDMEEAVAREDYRAAAALKAQSDELEGRDCVGAAVAALAVAVREERFADAARLRDESGVGVMGWWVGRGEGDSQGHLLRVTPDFGRYVATLYTPKEIAELVPELQSNPLNDPRLAAAAQTMLESTLTRKEAGLEDGPPIKADETGLPVLELFLREAPEGSGRLYEQQAAALYAPEAALAEAAEQMQEDAVVDTLAEFIAADTGSSVVSVEKGQNEDGSSFVKIEISSSPVAGDGEAADVAAADEDDDIRTIDDLAASVGMGPQDTVVPSSAGDDTAMADATSATAADADEAGASGRGEVDEDEEAQLLRWQEQAAAANAGSDGDNGEGKDKDGGEGKDGAAGASGRGVVEGVDALTEAVMAAGEIRFSSAEEMRQSQQLWEGDSFDDDKEGRDETPNAASQLGGFLQRAPAQITWQGRDRFTVRVSEPPALARQRQLEAEADAAAERAAEAALTLQGPPVRIIYDGKEQLRAKKQQQAQQQQQQEGGGDKAGGAGADEQAEPQQEQQAQQAQQQAGAGATEGSQDTVINVTQNETDSEEISVLLSGSTKQRQQAVPPVPPVTGQAADASSESAAAPLKEKRDRIEELERQGDEIKQRREQLGRERDALQRKMEQEQQEEVAKESAALDAQVEAIREQLQAGEKPSKEVLSEFAKRAMALSIHQGLTSANQAGAALAERFMPVEGHTTYERLALSPVKTDPFTGVYVGTFGPHGPELIQVSRAIEGGQEWAVATKLTGDPNVPAGTVTWKARIGKGNRVAADMYPPEFGVTARYNGTGQVAQAGFTNPKWVEGELLVLAGANSPFLRGAALGFTFDVNKQQRFLVLLNRVDLDAIFPEEDDK